MKWQINHTCPLLQREREHWQFFLSFFFPQRSVFSPFRAEVPLCHLTSFAGINLDVNSSTLFQFQFNPFLPLSFFGVFFICARNWNFCPDFVFFIVLSLIWILRMCYCSYCFCFICCMSKRKWLLVFLFVVVVIWRKC